MSTTLEELVSSIHSSLHSYTGVQEQVTYLTASCTDSDLTLSVNGSEQVMRGITEIGDELLYVASSDSGTLVIPPFGRGYRGSTAAAHSENDQVTFDPAFPRVEIIRSIHQQVEALYPALYQVKTTDLTTDSALSVGYEAPADCDRVLQVLAKYPGEPYEYWSPITRFSFDTHSPDHDGNVINLYGVYAPGTEFRLVYQAKFGTLTTNFETAGIPESYADMILYGVTSRMVRFVDPARMQVKSVENLSRSAVVQVGDGGKIANQLFAMFQTRQLEERRKLLELTPVFHNYLPR